MWGLAGWFLYTLYGLLYYVIAFVCAVVVAFLAYEAGSGMWNRMVTRLRYKHYREFLEDLVDDGAKSSSESSS